MTSLSENNSRLISPFLDCYIWSVHTTNQPYMEHNFFLVEKIYYYNSLTTGIIVFNFECMQIPEFEIKDMHLLDGLDYNVINQYSIPILFKDKDCWRIDLSFYNKFIETRIK